MMVLWISVVALVIIAAGGLIFVSLTPAFAQAAGVMKRN